MGIVLYSKKHCAQCNATKRKLDQYELNYSVVAIDENPDVLAHLQLRGFTQAPVVETDTDSWCGFRPDKLEQLAQASQQLTAASSAFDDDDLWA